MNNIESKHVFVVTLQRKGKRKHTYIFYGMWRPLVASERLLNTCMFHLVIIDRAQPFNSFDSWDQLTIQGHQSLLLPNFVDQLKPPKPLVLRAPRIRFF